MKEFNTSPKFPRLEPRLKMVYFHIQNILQGCRDVVREFNSPKRLAAFIYEIYLLHLFPYLSVYLSIYVTQSGGGGGFRIHRLHLSRGVRRLPTSVLYMTLNQSDGVAQVILELWEMRSTPSLPLLVGPFWPREVAPHTVLSMGQIKLFDI